MRPFLSLFPYPRLVRASHSPFLLFLDRPTYSTYGSCTATLKLPLCRDATSEAFKLKSSIAQERRFSEDSGRSGHAERPRECAIRRVYAGRVRDRRGWTSSFYLNRRHPRREARVSSFSFRSSDRS